MYEFLFFIGSFIEKGGFTLVLIFFVAFLMWANILNRLFFHIFSYDTYIKTIVKQLKERSNPSRAFLHKIKEMHLHEHRVKLQEGQALLNILILICPLLGLLGTVTGMINVFDVITIAGNSDVKAMSSGISQATIPTMTGMSVALSGLFFKVYFHQYAQKKEIRLIELLHARIGR
jgi:biopolymer transport protein ExbB